MISTSFLDFTEAVIAVGYGQSFPEQQCRSLFEFNYFINILIRLTAVSFQNILSPFEPEIAGISPLN